MSLTFLHRKTTTTPYGRRPIIRKTWRRRLVLFQLFFMCCVLSLWLPGMFNVTIQLDSERSFELLDSKTTSRRFPKYGTSEFARQCAWSLSRDERGQNCTLLVSPLESWNEGMAAWLSLVLSGFFMARQTDCRFLMDYGPDIDISKILIPRHPEDNWTVPTGFECTRENRCHQVTHAYRFDDYVRHQGVSQFIPQGSNLFGVPSYRHGYLTPIDNIPNMQKIWPDFKKETAPACAFQNILQLSPKAFEMEPQLFSRILPILQDPDSLVMAIYIRTGKSDDTTRKVDIANTSSKNHLGCALELERQHLTGNHSGAHFSFSRIVWMLVTDSPELKRQVIETYDKKDTNALVPPEQQKWKNRFIPRAVLGTQARGKHTKTKWAPSTADFAEALLDWYLIGESDLVILFAGYSFGATGALRTARRVYEQNGCKEIFLKN